MSCTGGVGEKGDERRKIGQKEEKGEEQNRRREGREEEEMRGR